MSLEIKNFDNLDFKSQLNIIKKAPYLDKGDLILRSEGPGQLLRSLDNEEFYLVYSSSSNDLKSELLAKAKGDQLVFVSDFEVWQKDEIEERQFLSWLDILNHAESNAFFLWALETDLELIVAGLLNVVEVIKTQHLELIDDYIGDRPFVTLDNLYYFNIECDYYDAVRKLIDLLFSNKKAYYINLMEGLICSSKAEVEEAAYQYKTVRAALSGFPDKDESMIIYQEIKEFSEIEEKSGNVLPDVSEPGLSWQTIFPVLQEKNTLFLDSVLSLYNEKVLPLSDINSEFIALSNKIIVVEDFEFKNPHALYESLERARKIVSLGLEDLSHGKLEDALDLFRRHWIESLFRWGITKLKGLRRFCLEIYNETSFTEVSNFLKFLGPEWGMKFQGLFSFCPVKTKKEAEYEVIEYEDFKSPSEVEELYEEICDIKDMLYFFKGCFGGEWEKLVLDAQNEIIKDVNIVSLFGTLLAHLCLHDEVSFEPLKPDDVKCFVRQGFEQRNESKKIKLELKEKCLKVIGCSDNNNKVVNRIIEGVEVEMAFLNLDMDIEAKYLSVLLIRE